jgi:cell division protein FtsZ
MFSQHIEGVNFVICNTDAQALTISGIPNRIQLGPHLTQGLGAGANPDIGRQATEESLEEIKRILEVNTKMAFITAGMGGGTGTGGAPIIAKICKDLGILTVGIVTTPFAYEGKKRQQQAQEGIKNLEQYVDTLLVISNDKLRHQFGNLKMREAFEKADNVLATAAKCITDVINSTGQINVDFADVCTVMKNGGVAILGNAEAAGENRAQRAVEEALNSPLLNDSDIRGAKWILINITSCTGEHEFTMDEVEIIQQYILTQAGEDTDVILGMGYDTNLGDKLGITLIATGFEHKDPFTKPAPRKEENKTEEKIVMVLGQPAEEPKAVSKPDQAPAVEEKEMEVMEQELQGSFDPLMPVLVEEMPLSAPVIDITDLRNEEPAMVMYELEMPAQENPLHAVRAATEASIQEEPVVSKMSTETKEDTVHSTSVKTVAVAAEIKQTDAELIYSIKDTTGTTPAAAGGYLARPSNIYAESKAEENTSMTSVEKPVPLPKVASVEEEELLDLQMQLVERDDIPAEDMPLAHQTQRHLTSEVEDLAMQDETEEQNRRAAERLNKLRNLSFNVNAADPNNEFETVPAYIRRNMELYNNNTQIENFYSSYEVKTDSNNQSQISSINTFLEGKKPD